MTVTIDGQTYRLVGAMLFDDAVNRRLRKANGKAQKKCRGSGAITNACRLFVQNAIFLTSLPMIYGMKMLYTIYRISWQIELVFRTWKSIISIHKIRSARRERLMCEVYGKLILAAISAMIAAKAEI